jgi:hypothetical protein
MNINEAKYNLEKMKDYIRVQEENFCFKDKKNAIVGYYTIKYILDYIQKLESEVKNGKDN